jgi:hypothetical protein
VSAPQVDVLRCPACGADVALGPADDARCAHCGKAVRVPDAHRELRSLQREDQGARHRAQALLSTLDSPPWLVTRVLAAVFDQPALAFWIYFGVPVGLLSIVAGLAVDARLHPPPAETVGGARLIARVGASTPTVHFLHPMDDCRPSACISHRANRWRQSCRQSSTKW